MSEDEAFIRAIVDSPGDDTPRLVYADWLDDRADPRGPYLRAEREAVETGDVARLRELAAGLDPVWVTRVSRPPAGVCCDRIRFEQCGAALGAPDIELVEQELGGRFSADFFAFLLNYNGGVPRPGCLSYRDPAWADMDLEIEDFFTANRSLDEAGKRLSEIESEREWLEELYRMGDSNDPNPLIAGLAPIGHTSADLGYLLIGIGDTNRGRVFHFRDYCHFSNDPSHLFEHTDTLGQFLNGLRPCRPL
ncbi:TIGR02996 domain-containing protein [Gemmata sp. JC717]|uniref:TIGR02996 domain-containing protein n=1 Tax=Gemmata algarum TaxID=2975278 RepID=UPI0021BBAFB7|nr:TIGR02996 domain-containing protein [Gemmata algarum]MDY3553002.1 TIGR02996 domain-containing protein [Gemmata algarum]